MNYQDMIDQEQNRIIKRAHGMTNHQLQLILVELGYRTRLQYPIDRQALIDLYCEKMFERLYL